MAIAPTREAKRDTVDIGDIAAKLDELHEEFRRNYYQSQTLAQTYATGRRVSSKIQCAYFEGQATAFRWASERVEELVRSIRQAVEVT